MDYDKPPPPPAGGPRRSLKLKKKLKKLKSAEAETAAPASPQPVATKKPLRRRRPKSAALNNSAFLSTISASLQGGGPPPRSRLSAGSDNNTAQAPSRAGTSESALENAEATKQLAAQRAVVAGRKRKPQKTRKKFDFASSSAPPPKAASAGSGSVQPKKLSAPVKAALQKSASRGKGGFRGARASPSQPDSSGVAANPASDASSDVASAAPALSTRTTKSNSVNVGCGGAIAKRSLGGKRDSIILAKAHLAGVGKGLLTAGNGTKGSKKPKIFTSHEGTLRKNPISRTKGKPKDRFFKLHDGVLKYFTTRSGKLKGTIQLTKDCVLHQVSRQSFTLDVPGTGKLVASSLENDAEGVGKWMLALQNSLDQLSDRKDDTAEPGSAAHPAISSKPKVVSEVSEDEEASDDDDNDGEVPVIPITDVADLDDSNPSPAADAASSPSKAKPKAVSVGEVNTDDGETVDAEQGAQFETKPAKPAAPTGPKKQTVQVEEAHRADPKSEPTNQTATTSVSKPPKPSAPKTSTHPPPQRSDDHPRDVTEIVAGADTASVSAGAPRPETQESKSHPALHRSDAHPRDVTELIASDGAGSQDASASKDGKTEADGGDSGVETKDNNNATSSVPDDTPQRKETGAAAAPAPVRSKSMGPCRGWLLKSPLEGRGNKRNRFAALQAYTLQYFTGEDMKDKKGEIPVTSASKLSVVKKTRTFILQSASHKFTAEVASDKELDKWIEAFKQRGVQTTRGY